MTEDGATTLEDTVEGGRRNMKRPRRESHDWMGHGNNCGQKSLSRAIMEFRGSTSDVIVALLSSLCPVSCVRRYSYCTCAMTILMIEFSLAVWKHPNMAMHAPVSLLSDRARYVSAYTGHYNYLYLLSS